VLCGCINATTAQGLTVMIFTPKARTCEEVLSLESIVRAAQSSGTIWVTSDQARAVGWYEEVSGWIEGYVTATNVYDARSGGTGNVTRTSPTGSDLPAIWTWVMNWCRQNPRDDIVEALDHYGMA
jgi:hypothetical protein